MRKKGFMITLNLFFLAGLFYLFASQSVQPAPSDFVRGYIYAFIVFSSNLFADWKLRKAFDLIWVFFLGNMILLVLGGHHIARVWGTAEELDLSVSGHLPSSELYNGFLLIFCGAFCFIIGFYISQRKLLNRPVDMTPQNFRFPSDIQLWFWIFLSWGSKWFGFIPGVLGTAVGWLSLGALYVFSCRLYFSQLLAKNKYTIFIVTIVIMELTIASRSAMREPYLTIFLPVLLALGTVMSMRLRNPVQKAPVKRQTKRFFVIGLAALVIFVLYKVVFPAANLVKQGDAVNFKIALAQVLNPDKNKINLQDLEGSVTKKTLALRRAVIITSAAICIDLSKRNIEMEYDPVKLLAAGYVPRRFWPDKPVIAKGGWFNDFLRELAGHYGESRTSMALSAAGELFWAYGLAGMMIIMLFTGAFFSKIGQMAYTIDLRNIFDTGVSLAIVSFYLKAFEGDWSQAVSLVSLLAIVSWFARRFSIQRKRPGNKTVSV